MNIYVSTIFIHIQVCVSMLTTQARSVDQTESARADYLDMIQSGAVE